MITHNLGYPRIGDHRELKKANEKYWAGKITATDLEQVAKSLRTQNWHLQKKAGIQIIPCNDFSFYDQVLDTSMMVGCVPEKYHKLMEEKQLPDLDLMFAMARGYQKDDFDITAMEMTKWFDTNYHFIVPEFKANQKFCYYSKKILHEFLEAKRAGINAKPVMLGPISFLLLGKEKETGFKRLELIRNLLPVYLEVLKTLDNANAHYIQIDEPCLSLNLTEAERSAFVKVYGDIKKAVPDLHIILASYFECYGDNLPMVLKLPVQTLHLDLVRCPNQLDDILDSNISNSKLNLSLGVVEGRNIWKNDFSNSLELICKAKNALGEDRLMLAPSCSLLHVPCDLEAEIEEENLPSEIKNWLSFARQKIEEVVILAALSAENPSGLYKQKLAENIKALESRKASTFIHKSSIKERINAVSKSDTIRKNYFNTRKIVQQKALNLPLFPTTTIGSFPQTKEVRSWRAKLKKGELSEEAYDKLIKKEIETSIRWQEEVGIDVLVHGEFERNDMVEYFGEQLEGFVFTSNGWVQSYGSRCVKPPIIVGDVERKKPMTIKYTEYAQSLSNKIVKGMLTGPVTILQWSFVRNDQPRAETCLQIAFAIRDEVIDLEKANIKVIQIDEPAIREGLPLRVENWQDYLNWAIRAFSVSSSGIKDETQIHTHMCYSEFNDIIEDIAAMDADVITIETSRSQMELLEVFAAFKYPNDIGPGVYDIHSPRVPSKQEMIDLIYKAMKVIPANQLWINPDCGLKTRDWPETKAALEAMIEAAKELRENVKVESVELF